MIRPNLILDLNHELIVDNFAGGGGASTGIERALGRHVDHAINHDAAALGMHRINHAQTVHHCEDVFDVDPLKLTEGRPVGLGWFSPDCKHFSKAKGGKPLSKKIRGLAFVILRWAKIRTRVIYMENVEEIQTWGPLLPDGKADPAHKGRTWQSFLACLQSGLAADSPDMEEILQVLGDTVTRAELERGFGYTVQTRELRACDFGAPTIRKRLFLIARCDGQPIHWPEATHADPKGRAALLRRQHRGSDALPSKKLKPWVPVSTCIDWDVPCHSIFLTKPAAKARGINVKRPLAKSTMRRIATGIDRYVLKSQKPFLVSLTHQGGDRVEPMDQPGNTITGAHRGEKAVVAPTLSKFHGDHKGRCDGAQRNQPLTDPLLTQDVSNRFAVVNSALAPFINRAGHSDESPGGVKRWGKGNERADVPLGTQPASNEFAIVGANLIQTGHLKSNSKMVKGADEPMRCQVSRPEHGVVSAYLAQHNGGFNTTVGHEATAPLSTVSAKGSQQQIVQSKLVAPNLVAYYGNDKEGQAIDEPARTVTTKERFGLVESEVACGLTPEQISVARQVAEFLRAHGVEFLGEFATLTVDGIQYVIVDIGMRMLTARELFRAQGFGNEYIIDRAWLVDPHTGAIREVKLTKEQQIRMCGNSVCPDVAEAIVRANSADLAIWRVSERNRCPQIAQRTGRLKKNQRPSAQSAGNP